MSIHALGHTALHALQPLQSFFLETLICFNDMASGQGPPQDIGAIGFAIAFCKDLPHPRESDARVFRPKYLETDGLPVRIVPAKKEIGSFLWIDFQ